LDLRKKDVVVRSSMLLRSGLEAGVLTVNASRDRDVARFFLRGELVLCTASSLERAMRRTISPQLSFLVADLDGLTLIDSAGIHALLDTKDACTGTGTEFLVRMGDSAVGRILRIAGVTERLGIA
jgi:anti-anti-sigma factor